MKMMLGLAGEAAARSETGRTKQNKRARQGKDDFTIGGDLIRKKRASQSAEFRGRWEMEQAAIEKHEKQIGDTLRRTRRVAEARRLTTGGAQLSTVPPFGDEFRGIGAQPL